MSNDKMFYLNVDKQSKNRFDLGKFMEFTDNYDPLTSNFLKDLNTEVSARNIYQITGEESRPDLVSFKKYSDTQYWWVINLYNKKILWDDLSIGESVKMPEMDSLEDFYFSMKAKENIK